MARRSNPDTARYELRVPPRDLSRWQELADAEDLSLAQAIRRAMTAAVKSAEKRGILTPEKKDQKST